MENNQPQKMPLIPVKGYKWYIRQESAPYPGTGDGRYWEVSLREGYSEEPLARAVLSMRELEYLDEPSPKEILCLADKCLERLAEHYSPARPIPPTLDGEYLGGQELPVTTRTSYTEATPKKGNLRWKSKFLKFMGL